MNWDREVDLVVAGAGAGGMAAALTARILGLDVLIAEKTDRVGGSTAISGGAVWLPGNHQAAQAGHPDTRERIDAYMAATVGEAAPARVLDTYIAAGPRMLEFLSARTHLQLVARTYSPDYYPDRAGASFGGRALDPAEFDGRLLGRDFARLRDPLPEFMVLGGMMVNMNDVWHLLAATRSFTSWRHGMRLIRRYASDRLRGYHRGTRLVLGNALAARLFRSVLDRAISVWLESPIESLERGGPDGPVTGAVIRHDGRSVRVRARRGVVIATGGFAWDKTLRGETFPEPTGPWSMAPAGNAGDGIRVARAVGGTLRAGNLSPAFWAPVSVLEREDGSIIRYPHLVWDRAKPGLIAVNASGRRFVNEATSYHEFVIGMYRSHRDVPSVPAFLLADHDFMERFGLGLALPGGRPRQHLVKAGYLVKANDLAALAAALRLPAEQLQRTVERYNEHAARGEDPDFGKGSTEYNRYLGAPNHRPNPCLAPIVKPPFYAVRVYPGDIGTALGLAVDDQARVLDAAGDPIEGLYCAGNDMGSVLAGAYPGPGITLGPALTFGYVAGMSAAGKDACTETALANGNESAIAQ
ncbi:MAG: FAD-binding protein [Burkholderiaceae bacterium]|nr:FAD-binding protein [Burkholderiaceae bacterium]